MKRHLIIGRFSSADGSKITTNPGEQATELALLTPTGQLNHGIGDALTELNRLGVFPTEVGVDLLIIAAHVHAADTRISRVDASQDSWTREIRLAVPVSTPSMWRSASSVLTSMLNFLTGDRWEFDFRSRPSDSPQYAPDKTSSTPPVYDRVALFSGGLDSLIGAIDLLEDGMNPLLVSHAGDGATSPAQHELFGSLKAHYKTASFDRLRVWMAFHTGLVKDVRAESTTRGRSFLFIALGAFAGSGLGTDFVLNVPENGLIALNVPLDILRLGSNSTRTTHPYYMARWNELLQRLGIAGRVENPYRHKTKGEMVTGCANAALLRTLASASLSCSSPTKGRWAGHGTRHCGYCLPCLIRRAALEHAWGAGSDPTSYSITDLKAQPLSTGRSEGKQVRSFQVAIARLRSNPTMNDLLIHKPGSLKDVQSEWGQLADVYKRGMEEVAALVQGVRTQH